MIIYNWQLDNLDRKASNGLVTTAHWRATAQDGEYVASVYGTVGFEGETPVIPYADLTKEEVLAWVYEKLSKDEIEANLATQIEALKNPVQESGVPW
jgi:DUF2075 family protein